MNDNLASRWKTINFGLGKVGEGVRVRSQKRGRPDDNKKAKRKHRNGIIIGGN